MAAYNSEEQRRRVYQEQNHRLSNIALATDFSDRVGTSEMHETADIDKSNETISRQAAPNSLSSRKLYQEEQDDDYFVGHSRQKSVTVKEQRPNLRLKGMQGYEDGKKHHKVNNMFLKKAQTNL